MHEAAGTLFLFLGSFNRANVIHSNGSKPCPNACLPFDFTNKFKCISNIKFCIYFRMRMAHLIQVVESLVYDGQASFVSFSFQFFFYLFFLFRMWRR